MASRVEALASQLEAANAEYRSVVAGCSEEELRRVCPGEERSVAVVAHHMATVQRNLAGLLGAVMTGKPTNAPRSLEEIDRINAVHAHDNAGVSKQETQQALRAGGDAFLSQVRSLSDEDLGRGVGVLVGNEMTIGQVIELAVIAHQQEHLASIRAALAR